MPTKTQVRVRRPLWPKQKFAYQSLANSIVYGGAAGPGKSHLLRVAFDAWAWDIKGLQLYLFRRKYRDLIQGHMEGPTGFRALLEPYVRAGVVEIVKLEIRYRNGSSTSFLGKQPRAKTYTGGSRISLNHCLHEQDVFNYKSIEFHVLGLEEGTEFTKFQIQFLSSRVRMPSAIKVPPRYLMDKKFWRPHPVTGELIPRYCFPRILIPTNPGGPGHDYIFDGWIKKKNALELYQSSTEDGGHVRQYIPGLLTDNPSINPIEYAETLSGLPPAYRDALLKGLWTASIGSYYPEFEFDLHTLEDCDIPSHWYRFRTFDWGSTEPFAVHWWAVSPGETLRGRWIPRGALVCYNEWYGAEPKDGAKGIGMPNKEIAEGILARSEDGFKRVPTLTDSKPHQDEGGWTISKVFSDNGVILTLGDTSRVQGWSHLRDRLKGIEIEKGRPRVPMIYFLRSCKHIIHYIPMLQYHPSTAKPQDAQEAGEATHCCDNARYASMARQVIRDASAPLPELVARSVSERPTMKKILGLDNPLRRS